MWILFGLAMMATIARLAMRILQHRRVFLDDGFLLFACACLCAATGLLYRFLPVMYLDEGLNFSLLTTPFGPQEIDDLIWYQKMVYSFVVLSWVTIFAVKLSILVFFRNLIRRLIWMNTYWKVVIVTSLLACGFNICQDFITCSHFNLSMCK